LDCVKDADEKIRNLRVRWNGFTAGEQKWKRKAGRGIKGEKEKQGRTQKEETEDKTASREEI